MGTTQLPPLTLNTISGLGPWGPTHMLAVMPYVTQYQSGPADAYVMFHEPNGDPALSRTGDHYLRSSVVYSPAMELHVALRRTDRIVAQAHALRDALGAVYSVSAKEGFLRVVLPDVEGDGIGGLPLRPYARMLAETAREFWGKRPEAAPNQVVLAHGAATPSSLDVFRKVFDEELGRTNGDGFDTPPTRAERLGSGIWRALSPTGRRAAAMESILDEGIIEPVMMAAIRANVVADPETFDRGVVGALSALAMRGAGGAALDAIDILRALHVENEDVGPYAGWLLARIGLQINLAMARGRWFVPE